MRQEQIEEEREAAGVIERQAEQLANGTTCKSLHLVAADGPLNRSMRLLRLITYSSEMVLHLDEISSSGSKRSSTLGTWKAG